MSIICTGNVNRGTTTIVGRDIPNGDAILSRSTPGEHLTPMRGGVFEVTTGGFTKDDPEPPFGVPLTYRLDMAVDDRLIQRNLALTPTFLHGVQGWLAGDNRTLTIVTDPKAHSAQVGHVSGNPAGANPPDPPALIGHANGTNLVSGPYVLTPVTGGGTGIANGDWVFIHHQQLASVALPAAPTGFTEVWRTTFTTLSTIVWKRKRAAGDAGYSVPALTGAASIGSAVWVRGVSDTDAVLTNAVNTQGTNSITVTGLTLPRPSLALAFVAGQVTKNVTPPGAADVTGAVWQYTQGNGTDPRNTVVAAFPGTNAGTVPDLQVRYGASEGQGSSTPLVSGIAIQLAIQAPVPATPRIIAKAKAAAMPASGGQYLMTGRFKFHSTDLFIWQDVRDIGTWAAVKARGTWGQLRGANSAVGNDYVKLFVGIINPATGDYYVQPVQVINIPIPTMDQWTDFSFFFTTAVDIPTTAEVRFLHGTNLREYAIEWWLDEIGITAGTERPPVHNNVYWFDGDSTMPANPEDYLLPEGVWDATSSDADMFWSGTPGNSISVFNGPSLVSTATNCQLDGPSGSAAVAYCDLPVFLSDPVSPARAQWFSLVDIAPLSYQARQTLYDIINRAAVTAVSQVRAWATGELTLMTKTLQERTQTLTTLETGHILMLRNPDPSFPETSWYLAIGNVNESRIGPDARRPERLWTVPFARVERPSGLIDAQLGTVWQNVKDENDNWLGVRAKNADWLEVLTKVGTV